MISRTADLRADGWASRSGPRRPEMNAADLDAIDILGRKIALQIRQENWSGAHEAIAAAKREAEQRIDSPLLQVSLAEAGVSTRVCNKLEQHLNITTIEGLLNTPVSELTTISHFGAAGMFETLTAVLKFTIHRCLTLEAK